MSRLSALELLQPTFREPVMDLLAALARARIPLAIYETGRSPDRQTELYMRGRVPEAVDYGRTVTRAQAYESAHQFGYGLDLVFWRDNMTWTWDEPEAGMWDRYHELAEETGALMVLRDRKGRVIEAPHVQPIGFDWRNLVRGPMDTAGWEAWLRTCCAPSVA